MLLRILLTLLFFSCLHANEKPNIVYILADDMGYGDVQSLNPERGKIPTPHIDKLAAEGVSFTDAHTCSSVCTPTRYGLLTGRYNWRSKRQRGVLNGTSPALIPADRVMVGDILKDGGYKTAMIGKWHLGLDMPRTEGKKGIDWSGRIKGGPSELGFDYWYGISASLDFSPYIYIENDRFIGAATATKAFHRRGPAHPDFEAVDVLDRFAEKSIEYIAKQEVGKPFFLYVPLTSPHTPIVPTKKWQGKSGLSAYGDFMMQTDDLVGQIVQAIEDGGLSENTMVIVSSDNGCSRQADIPFLESKGHYPNGPFRGAKMDLWDGGHRVPHIVKWPTVVKPGTICDELICLNDFVATCSEIIGRPLADNEAEDSVSFLPALKGEPIVTERKGIVHSGGLKIGLTKEEMAASPKGQLYDMEKDPGELNNLYAEHPEIVADLMAQLKVIVEKGRSTPGKTQANDVSKVRIR